MSRRRVLFSAITVVMLVATHFASAAETVFLARDPALSPDGKTLAFAWNGDIWSVASKGGRARQLTRHPADDSQPRYSPNGKEIAFVSNRDGSRQVYVMPARGGSPERLTWHSEGYSLSGWYPDGNALLVNGRRDHFWRDTERFFSIARSERAPEHLLFDAYGESGSLSPDGTKLLFTREGMQWWRKGYHGSRASQVWLYDMETETFNPLLDEETGCRSPMWKPDGSSFYYVGAQSGSFNIWEYNLQTKQRRQRTHFENDSVVEPCISRDGSTIVFRHLFDLYRCEPGRDKAPERLRIRANVDRPRQPTERRWVRRADGVSFTKDGLEIAFCAGGDVWVMDTVLKEPRAVTNTPGEESEAVFSPDGKTILFIGERDGQSDLWRARRGDPERYWWQNDTFELDRLTTDSALERDLSFSPDGKKIAYAKEQGDLWIADADGSNARRLFESFHTPDYDWSPDSKWLVYAIADDDFNSDVWIEPVDGSHSAVNISRHPDDEDDPVWSPDGKVIAFKGQRAHDEVDIYYVWLKREDFEKTKRERSIEEAIEKMNKARKAKKDESKKDDDETTRPEKTEEADKATTEPAKAEAGAERKKDKEKSKVEIDFENIHERVRRVSIPQATEQRLLWSPDSKKLAFQAEIKGKRGTYTIEFPDELEPKLLSEKTGSNARWLKEGNQIVWLADGVPARLGADGKFEAYGFEARQEIDRPAHYRAGFIQAWRTMRDSYYDPRLNNRDWPAILEKYIDKAAQSPDIETFATIVSLMLGELNGSHLGFGPNRDPWRPEDDWEMETAHLGVRFARGQDGPGLKVRDVLPESPAARVKNEIEPGDVVLAIEGTTITAETDLTSLLNGPLERDIRLRIRKDDETTTDVVLRPISFSQARRLLYDKWLEDNRAAVDRLSSETLGYLHVRGMNWPSFEEFERQIYAAGYGRKGLIIDVRHNGGGFTTDHLLTVLCQPAHAITVPRGGGPGYPQDRRVYATWQRPIVVLCNQNSFSNAEIFSHAVKYLKRGPLVGVPTAGGVISTGGRGIMDLGTIRVPFRGWFTLPDGEDMELNGAVPEHILWPQPGEVPAGKDVQLEKAVEVLQAEVEKTKPLPEPEYRQEK